MPLAFASVASAAAATDATLDHAAAPGVPWAWVVAGALIGIALTGLWVALWSGARRKALARRIRMAESRARRAAHLAEIGAMTGGLAHEIKNPLSTIGLNADLLAESIGDLGIDEAERGRLLRRVASMRREAERLQDTLADFLEFAGEQQLELREIDLNTAVAELADFFHPQTEAAGVRLRTDTDGAALAVVADTDALKQALLNLMLNAVQAIGTQTVPGQGASGELIIRTGRGVFEDGRPSGRVEVIDTGPGIEGEHADRIFVPYFTTKPGGSGLGLPTTRRIVHAMDGEIAVDSEVGRGTRFTVDLPAADGAGPHRD